MEINSFGYLEDSGYMSDPVACACSDGDLQVVWISWDSQGQVLRTSKGRPGAWGEPKSLTEPVPSVRGLSMGMMEEGAIVAWIDDGCDGCGLKIAQLEDGGGLGDIRLVVPASKSPADLSLACQGERYVLAWTLPFEGGRGVEMCSGANPAQRCLFARVDGGLGSHRRVSATMTANGIWIAWQREHRGRCDVQLRTLEGKIVDVSRIVEGGRKPGGISACPTLSPCSDGKGVWVGWQSDCDPTFGPGLVRWIEVAKVDLEGRVFIPKDGMKGVARRGEGEDQGFEAPSFATLGDGGLFVVGRGSQRIRAQVLGAGGWGELHNLDDEGWKCRGSRYTISPAPDGLWIVGREKPGVGVRFLRVLGPTGEPAVVEMEAEVSKVPTAVGERDEFKVGGKKVYFGDLHQHTAASDGTGTLEETFFRARYRYEDDICAVADHESFLGKRTPPGEWMEHVRLAQEFMEPGDFVTMPAFEWTGKMHPGPGHKVGYVPPSGGHVLSRDDENTSSSPGLMAAAKRAGALVFPHHVGWTGADMENHDSLVQTCWEIVSCHGAYERMGGPLGTRGDDKEGQFVADALDSGLRFGFVGGSDGHGLNWHHGVCERMDSHRTGLTGVFADQLTREGVYEALASRRCYATSGDKILLWFEVDGRPMGEEIPVTESVKFKVIVCTSDDPAVVSLVTNGGEERILAEGSSQVNVSGTLKVPVSRRWSYHFVRVVTGTGQCAWSSPIWLDAPGSSGSGLPAA